MALSQLVYQMGVNLQHFTQFLDLMNYYSAKVEAAASAPSDSDLATDPEYWKTVQQSLVQSQWARLYRIRAVAVIAMLDPHYTDEPGVAERRVSAMLRPAVVHRRTGRFVASQPVASHGGSASSRPSRPQARRGSCAGKKARRLIRRIVTISVSIEGPKIARVTAHAAYRSYADAISERISRTARGICSGSELPNPRMNPGRGVLFV